MAYPDANVVFITPGDDPGTESHRQYTPKGQYYYRESNGFIPLPLFGLIPVKDVKPQTVLTERVIPDLYKLGANALIKAHVDVRERPHWFLRFLGIPLLFMDPGSVTVTGTAVKRPPGPYAVPYTPPSAVRKKQMRAPTPVTKTVPLVKTTSYENVDLTAPGGIALVTRRLASWTNKNVQVGISTGQWITGKVSQFSKGLLHLQLPNGAVKVLVLRELFRVRFLK